MQGQKFDHGFDFFLNQKRDFLFFPFFWQKVHNPYNIYVPDIMFEERVFHVLTIRAFLISLLKVNTNKLPHCFSAEGKIPYPEMEREKYAYAF